MSKSKNVVTPDTKPNLKLEIQHLQAHISRMEKYWREARRTETVMSRAEAAVRVVAELMMHVGSGNNDGELGNAEIAQSCEWLLNQAADEMRILSLSNVGPHDPLPLTEDHASEINRAIEAEGSDQ